MNADETKKNSENETLNSSETKSEFIEAKNENKVISLNANLNSDETKTDKDELKLNSTNAIANSMRIQMNSDMTHKEFREGLQANATKPQQLSLRVVQSDYDFWNEFKLNYETIPEAFSALVELAKKQPEKIEVEKPTEVIKEIPIKLSPAQMIVTFNNEVADKIRMCRSFIAQGNVLTYEKGNDSSFISALVNLSVNKTLERNFPAIMRRMNLKANS